MGSNLYVAAAGAISRLRQLELVANNLAGADATGFKADRAIFRAAIESARPSAGGSPGTPADVYVGLHETRPNQAPGPVERTGAPLDVAIQGDGFFVVEAPSGERYTRAGSFSLDASRRLVTPEGYPVLGDGGPLTLDGSEQRILSDGSVSGGSGRLRIVRFEDPTLLRKDGASLFANPAGAAAEDVQEPSLLEGSLEKSNVQPAVEMAVLMILQRAFDANLHAMQSEDQATERLITEVSQ